ncbi:probable E3 ubiquitin-protein ligase HERC1 isoform X2 [Halichondria panicea]|uniref:probable E3 ubiquitin-protein ligase HERC1 isoform X2 n=1 Tax=Halichondria panicea TaxID=6063 RepID=UPI00312B81AE
MASSSTSRGQSVKWAQLDMEEVFSADSLQTHFKAIGEKRFFRKDRTLPESFKFPDFGAHELQPSAISSICASLMDNVSRTIISLNDIPSVLVAEAMCSVWHQVLHCAGTDLLSSTNVKRVLTSMKEEMKIESDDSLEEIKKEGSDEKKTANDVLIETGIRTGLTVVFSLLKQAWSQIAWQKQIEQAISASGSIVPFGGQMTTHISLPNEVLKSVLDILNTIPPLALSNQKSLSKLSISCLEQSTQFLEWILKPDSLVDANGKRLASEITLSLVLQQGSLVALMEWIGKTLVCLEGYVMVGEDVPRPCLSLEFSESTIEEIRKRTQLGSPSPDNKEPPQSFQPRDLTPDGNVRLIDFLLFLTKELSNTCLNCTSYFRDQNSTNASPHDEGRFLSETCEVYAFGSNSSSQLAMGSTEKFLKATSMQHMSNVQVVHAGQYCSFLIFGDGSVKACGKGSYGRLGLGNSENQPNLRSVGTFSANTVIRKIVSSKGSDGHSMAITADGQVLSWGDGNYGKLGHGDIATQKTPKIISAFTGKMVMFVACGNRHSAAVTLEGELYTWGEGEHGRLGHGNVTSQKSPTKVECVSGVKEVSCGVAHTLALSSDGLTVWSFGSGDSGKLGHGDTIKHTTPTVIEALRGMVCQRVCAASQFSIVLTAGGKVYSFGNGSGVGKGTTEPRQYTPWLIEPLEGEMIIDVCTGDGHCLALTQRGEVYAWGTNSMGQCGQGHNNGSITTPAKVQGLEGIQVQQISAGTSHSIAWTAMPINRRASAMWHWPYCVSVTEKTFQNFIALLTKYGDFTSEHPVLPFPNREAQELFLHSVLTLTSIHISLVAPLGPSCVRMACGRQVKPLRNLLFKFIDSQLPTALDKVTGEALDVGSSVLLPPVADRVSLLLSLLPHEPSQLSTLSTGQRHQLNILLQGFSDRNEFVGLIYEGRDKESIPNPYTDKLNALCRRMISYLHFSVISTLNETALISDLETGSPLLKTFEKFIVSVLIVSMTWIEKQLMAEEEQLPSCWVSNKGSELYAKRVVEKHFTLFYDVLKEHSMVLIKELTILARSSGDPVAFLKRKKDILLGFLCYQLPIHVCLSTRHKSGIDVTFSMGDVLLELAGYVHSVVDLYPANLVEQTERRELLSEPVKNMSTNLKNVSELDLLRLRGLEPSTCTTFMDFERLLCRRAAKLTKHVYASKTSYEGDECGTVSSKDKPSIFNSHFLCNGLIGNEQQVAEAFTTWVSLCLHMPGSAEKLAKLYSTNLDQDGSEPPDDLKPDEDYYHDYLVLASVLKLMFEAELLPKKISDIKPCELSQLSPLLSLAVGSKVNKQATELYDRMMELASFKDWNTCSDEDAVPQLRQVSCAALACLLKHTGLFAYAANCSSRPKKRLADVYRSVFSIRREVFNNRPVADSKGEVSSADREQFQSSCNMICINLMFITCLVDAAMPEESEPIVPQIGTTMTSGTIGADDALRSPDSIIQRALSSKDPPMRLLSHPGVQEVTSERSILSTERPSVEHSSSINPLSHTSQEGWSLPAVKQALSHLRWQRDRLHHLHSSTSHGPDSPLAKTCSVVVNCAVGLFNHEADDEAYLDRALIVQHMLIQQRRALKRKSALQRMVEFLSRTESSNYVLPSSKLLFMSTCMAHKIHYSDGIVVAPSVLQHEVKNLSHSLLDKMVKEFTMVKTTYALSQRSLMLALQWSTFNYQPGDLLLLFSSNLDLYTKVVSWSGVISSCLDPVTPSCSRLASRVRLACVLMSQLLSMEVGVHSEVLKSNPEILSLVAKHLFCQLESFVNNKDPDMSRRWEAEEYTDEEREEMLGEFLTFVNTLSATHETMRCTLASDPWFLMLLRIVDVHPDTGKPVIRSLKTRLLALQALGAIMVNLTDTSPEAQSKCSKIVDDLLELMSRCMFQAPIAEFNDTLDTSPLEEQPPPIPERRPRLAPFLVDPVNQDRCTVTREEDDSQLFTMIEGTGSSGYAMGISALTGKHQWQVKVTSVSASFCVGVGQKPLTDLATSTSDQFWLYESHTGRLVHGGETGDLLPSLSRGDTLKVVFDKEEKTLSLTKNEENEIVAFRNVYKEGKDLFPVFLFNRSHNTTKIVVDSFSSHIGSVQSALPMGGVTSSGYPLLSPTSTTLVQAVVSMLYQVQHKQPWSKAITNVLIRRLSETENIVHRLLDFQTELMISEAGNDALFLLSQLLSRLTKFVWPCLALVGGMETGFCLGKKCQLKHKDEQITGTIVSIPDAHGLVKVQGKVPNDMKRRSCSLSDLKLVPGDSFSLSLLLDHLTPAMLTTLAYLAGFLDREHSLHTILQSVQDAAKRVIPLDVAQSIAYQQLCGSLLQLAATKTLHTILYDESIVKLLTYQPPSMDTVVLGDYVDKTELSVSMREVLRCLACRAIKPSPLSPALKLHELERLLSLLAHQTLSSIAEDISKHDVVKAKPVCQSEATTTSEVAIPTISNNAPSIEDTGQIDGLPLISDQAHDLSETLSLSSSSDGSLEDLSPAVQESQQQARAPTPPIVNTFMDMGFSRAQVNIALNRCEVPSNSTEEARMQLLVSWIIDHPNAVAEEEAAADEPGDAVSAEEERQREQQQQQQQEADRNAAADEFLSIMMDPGMSPSTSEVVEQKSISHAPDLLDGPDIEEEVPDVSLSGLDSSPQSLKSLLSALGLSKKNPTPRLFEFPAADPLGTRLCKTTTEDDSTDTVEAEKPTDSSDDSNSLSLSKTCENVAEQITKLKNLDEHLVALDRVSAATQTLVARRIIMLVIASLSTQGSTTLITSLQSVNLDSIQSLVRLLRLVDAGRIDGRPGDSFSVVTPSSLLPLKGLDCLSSAITTAVTQSHGSGKQLMSSCSRDLLAAAVGGAELFQQAGQRRRRQRRHIGTDEGAKSDISILTNPNFSVTRNLVQTLAKSTGQLSLSVNSTGMLQIIDALAACLFSSKLKPEHRFWALEQLLEVFSRGKIGMDTSSVIVKDESHAVSCQLEHLVGHKGQIMNCSVSKSANDRVQKIISIGEDNSAILWDLDSGLTTPQTTTLTFSTPSQEPRSSPQLENGGLMLPTLTQSFSGTCMAGAVDNMLCVWRTRDGKTATERFADLITALQWKPAQKGSETPVLLVGLINGGVEMIEVLRDSGASASPPEIQTSRIEARAGAVCCVTWSPSSSAFAVGSTAAVVQVYVGAGCEYSVTTEIKEIQVQSMCWSPDGSFLTTLEKDGVLKLWDVYGELPTVIHSFDAYPTSFVQWHPVVSSAGSMLLASGSKNGSVHLWTIRGKRPSDLPESESNQSYHRGLVSHVTCLEGHPAPITSLVFNEEACLLASGCKAGSVRVWDLYSFRLLKYVVRSVGEVLNMCWTDYGLAVCYNNTCSLCILPPSPQDYTSERCLQSCLPSLHSLGIVDLDKAPCLMALLKNLHLVLHDQYSYEETEMTSSQQLVHTEYLQLLTSLTVGLGLHTVLLSSPHPPHLTPPPLANDWTWLANFTQAVKMADSLCKRTPLPEGSGFTLPAGVEPLPEIEKYRTTDNSVWTLSMDSQIMEWLCQRPQDWWATGKSNVYTWGKGSWNQLGHTTSERGMPAVVDNWNDVQQIVAGSYCTYAVKFDGSVSSCGEGSYGRLGHGGSESETGMRNISALQGIPIVQLVAGPRISTTTDEGFAIALTETGNVYSWGKGYKGRLGHQGSDNVRSPKLIEAFSSVDVVMIAAGDYHCAVVSSQGELYTMGSKDNGKLGRGSSLPTSSRGNVTVGKVDKFFDSNETTQLLNDVKIGYVSCGQYFTLAISKDGSQVFGFGKSDDSALGNASITGGHQHPFLLAHLSVYGPFTKSVSGNRASALLNAEGKVVCFGNLVEGGGGNAMEANIMEFPDNEKIIDLATAAQYMMALSENGNVYCWGKTAFRSTTTHTTPQLMETLVGKGLKQISAGVRHGAASDTIPPIRGSINIRAPSELPVQYTTLKDISFAAIYSRMLLLSHFSRIMMSSWKLFHLRSGSSVHNTVFSINPLSDAGTRSLLAPASIEGLVAAVISKTMNSKQHGPSVTVNRLADSDSKLKPVFPQLATQILQKSSSDLWCSSRAWKVSLTGEGADDAGGVFDETVTQMCEEMEKGEVKIFIQTPNARNKCGFNTDRYVFDPTCTLSKDLKHLKFVGILFGVAMRTRKPLDLHLAQPMWKMLAGMTLTSEDLEEIDMIFIQSMNGIKDIHKSGMKEEDFAEMIPIESFEAQSMSGKFVPIVPGGGNIRLTFQNRKEYVEKAFYFRLHELDKQIATVREGMATIVPVPLLSLYTANMLERAVCGSEEINLQLLKKVVRYRDGTSETTSVVAWLWQTLESFTNDERVLFLRFVSGRSRLPVKVSEINQRFQISVQRQVNDHSLPTSQTCFFQLRLPSYTSQDILAERLRYAITHCRSIDMDTYMLRGGDDYDTSPPYSDDDDIYT